MRSPNIANKKRKASGSNSNNKVAKKNNTHTSPLIEKTHLSAFSSKEAVADATKIPILTANQTDKIKSRIHSQTINDKFLVTVTKTGGGKDGREYWPGNIRQHQVLA